MSARSKSLFSFVAFEWAFRIIFRTGNQGGKGVSAAVVYSAEDGMARGVAGEDKIIKWSAEHGSNHLKKRTVKLRPA